MKEGHEAGAEHVLLLADKDGEIAAQEGDFTVVSVAPGIGNAEAIALTRVEDDVLVLSPHALFQGPSPSGRMAALMYRGIEGCVAVRPAVPEDVGVRLEIDEGIGAIRSLTSGPWLSTERYGLGLPIMSYLNELCGDPAFRVNHPAPTMADLLTAALEAKLDLRGVPVQPDQQWVPLATDEQFHAARWLQWED